MAPNYWNLLTSDDNAYMTMRTASGRMGCIAQLLKKAGTENQGMIIRKDWLEASGVGDVDTLDKFEEYLTYCKDTYGRLFLSPVRGQRHGLCVLLQCQPRYLQRH